MWKIVTKNFNLKKGLKSVFMYYASFKVNPLTLKCVTQLVPLPYTIFVSKVIKIKVSPNFFLIQKENQQFKLLYQKPASHWISHRKYNILSFKVYDKIYLSLLTKLLTHGKNILKAIDLPLRGIS